MKNILFTITIILAGFLTGQSQHVFHAKGGQLVMKGESQLVLSNTSYVNGGSSLQGDSALVRFSGSNTDSIGGLPTTFVRLEIDKDGGDVQLKKGIGISDSLMLTDGNIILDDQNLELLPGAGTQEGNRDSYVQTSGTGFFKQIVDPQEKVFPIGGNTYNPLNLKNIGTSDVYSARVTNSVLTQGSTGSNITVEAIAATWFLEEAQVGGSDLDMQLLWYQANELAPFDPANCFISSYTSGWDQQSGSPATSIGGANVPYTQDRNNLTTGGIFAVFTKDVFPPRITCPVSINVSNDQDMCSAVVTYAVPLGTDNQFEPSTRLTDGLGSGATFPIGTTTEEYTVTDAVGLTANCVFDITVHDTQAPEISCPSSISVNNDAGVCGAAVNYQVTIEDNCSGESLSQTAGMASGSVFPIGTTSNSFTVTDAAGNTASCSVDVTVSDNENPTINCPANLVLANNASQCGRMVTYLQPIGQDNCNSNTVRTSGLGSGSTFSLGSTTETYEVTDASGNTASCTFTITINDEEDPVISLNGDNPVLLCEGDSYVEAGATASDNCDASVNQNIIIDASQVNIAVDGGYNVTYTVTDVNGNSAQATRLVIVKRLPAQLAPQNCGSCSQIRFDFCEGDAAPDLEALLQGNTNFEVGTNFLWYADNSNSQGNPITPPTPNMVSNNTRFYWVSQIANDCEGPARRVRVRVRRTSNVVLDLPSIGCGTSQLDLAAWVSDNRNFATGYTFYNSDPDVGNPSAIGSVTASNGIVNNGQYAVVTLPANPVTYYAVASNTTGCQVTGRDEVQAGAGASLDSVADIIVNSGNLVHVNFNSPDASYIMWVNHSSFNNPYIGLLGSFGLGDLVFTAQNNGSSPRTAMLRAIAYNGNCAGQVRDFYITVNPGTNNRQAQNSLQFTASRINAHDVQLDWQITYEFALAAIEIEKQKNDGEWVTIGRQDATVGTHYNVSLQNGTHLDRGGMANETKYRLKLVHADGRAIWSQEVKVNFNYFNSKRFTLYPNPSNGRFNLRAAGPIEGDWRYKLTDQMGRTILIGKLQGSETPFDISHLPAAHYFLLLTSPEGKQYLQRVVKN